MTVAELIESLKTLPQDMEIQVMTSEGEGPNDIVQVSRGTWSDNISDDEINDDWEPSDVEPEFFQDDENGKIAVLVTW
jgi:hypothetical protein